MPTQEPTHEELQEYARSLIEHALQDITLASRIAGISTSGPLGRCVAEGIAHLHGEDSFQAKVARAVVSLPPPEEEAPDA